MIMEEDLNNRNLNSGEMFWRYPAYPNSLLSTTEEKNKKIKQDKQQFGK